MAIRPYLSAGGAIFARFVLSLAKKDLREVQGHEFFPDARRPCQEEGMGEPVLQDHFRELGENFLVPDDFHFK